jgi:hypothetical protein
MAQVGPLGSSGPGWSRSHLSSLIEPLSLQRVASGALSVSYTLSGTHNFWSHFSSQQVFCFVPALNHSHTKKVVSSYSKSAMVHSKIERVC